MTERLARRLNLALFEALQRTTQAYEAADPGPAETVYRGPVTIGTHRTGPEGGPEPPVNDELERLLEEMARESQETLELAAREAELRRLEQTLERP